MMEIIRVARPVEISESDVITLSEAARLSGRSIAVISGMLDRGTLPWYVPSSGLPGRMPRFTSRAAVLALPAPDPRRRGRRRGGRLTGGQ